MDTNIKLTKPKINGLRAQLEREIAKFNKTKSGQSTKELYSFSWIDYSYFLLPAIKFKSKDTLKHKNEEKITEVEETRLFTPGIKKQNIAERKLDFYLSAPKLLTKKTSRNSCPFIFVGRSVTLDLLAGLLK